MSSSPDPCPMEDCGAPQAAQALSSRHDDGCSSWECTACGVVWSPHLVEATCPDFGRCDLH